MNDIVFFRERDLQQVTPVENAFITRYMPTAPELAVKAYLYGLMRLNCPLWDDGGDICSVLGCTADELKAAFAYWEAAGLVRLISDEPLKVQYVCVKNAGSGASRELDGAYADFVRSLQSVLGTRVLSGSELTRIYDWLDVFGFEQGAAVAIVKHCLDTKGAKTGVAYMDAVAKTLVSKGILTLDGVNEYFADEALLSTGAAKILKRWNRRGLPTEDQIALYEKWTKGWGFDEESIALACEQMTSADKPSFKYLDSVLDAWRQNGYISKDSIRELGRQEDAIVELARRAFSRAGIKRSATREDRLYFRDWNIDKSMSAELILFAADLSRESSRPFAEMKRILGDWYEAGISSLPAAKEQYETAKADPKRKKNTRALNYIHGGKYTDDELKKLGISLGEEFYDNAE